MALTRRFEYVPIEPRLICAFTVPGVPVPKARPRFDSRHSRTFTPQRTAEGEARVQQHLFVSQPRLRPCDGRMRLEVTCYLPGAARGDWDNFGKLISDALNGAAWRDDRQVAEAHIRVQLFAPDPRTEIRVWLLEEPRAPATMPQPP